MSTKGKAVAIGNKKTSKYWADQINSIWRQTAEAYLKMGKLLVEARATLEDKEYKKLLDKDLDFDERKAQKLVRIARNPVLTAPSNVKLLPPSYSTLNVLAQLDNSDLKRLFTRGDIHPNMERADAEELVEKLNPKKPAAKTKPVIDREGAEDIEEEAEDEESADEESGESEEPTPVKRPAVPIKGGLDQALENFSGGLESIRFFSASLEEHLEKVAKPLPKEVIKDIREVTALLNRMVKELA